MTQRGRFRMAFDTRLAGGQLRMVGTLVGFGLGVAMALEVAPALPIARPLPAPPMILQLAPYTGALALLLWVWAGWELRRLWRTRPLDAPLVQLMLAKDYRLSTSAMIMGLAGGILFMLHGPWNYTGVLRKGVEGLVVGGVTPAPMPIALFAAVFTGMGLSTWHRGSFRLSRRVRPSWAMNLASGLLMGVGAVLVPGGNDALIIYSIPILSSHAVPAYFAMLGGIAFVIVIMRYLTGAQMRIECHSDVCLAPTDPPVRA